MEINNYQKMSSDNDKIAGLYNIGNTIGRGHYAVVKEAKHVFTQEKVAIKVIDKTKLDAQSREHLFSEVMCMKLVQHPNVVRLYEVIDTANKLYLILELGDAGDLYDYIMKYENGLPEMQAKRYFRQIVEAISYCHNLHVVHRDLKPENVVFFEKLELVKLTDFGFSNKFTPGQTLQTSCGSLAYSAPEILLGDAYDAPKVDIWSLGVILFMLVCGRLPFDEANDSETLSRIMDCRYELPTRLSLSCCALIRSMLVRAPEKRATLEQILAHDWMERDLHAAAGDSYAVPLISQQHLSVEEHVDILTKMSEGNLASVEDIQITLDRNEYSYITATYFLLAERKLKRRNYENFCKMKLLRLDEESKLDIDCSNNNMAQAANDVSEERIRRFSMILEDEEVEEEEEELEAMISLASVREELALTVAMGECPSQSGTTAPCPSRCCSRLSDDIIDLDLPSVSLFSNFKHQFTQRNRCRSAIYSNRSPLYPSQSFSSIIENSSQRQLRPFKTRFQRNLSGTFTNEDAVYGVTRHRASLPGQPSQSTNNNRRSYPVLSYNMSPSHSNSDISDNEMILLRGYSDQKRISVPKSFGKHFLALSSHQKYHSYKPLTPDWMNSNSSIDSDGSHYHNATNRRLRIKSANSRPNSMGATINMSSDDEDGHRPIASVVVSNSPTVANITMHRDICAPIHEEDELIRSRSYIDKDTSGSDSRHAHMLNASFRSVSVDCRRKSESAEGTPARWVPFCQARYPSKRANNTSLVAISAPLQPSHKIDSRSLSSHLSQSNFSLSSFASSLRDSKAMMNVVRGAFELQCLANKISRQNRSGRYAVSSSANVSNRQSRSDFASATSLPLGQKLHSPDDSESAPAHDVSRDDSRNNVRCSSPATKEVAVHSSESLLGKADRASVKVTHNRDNLLLRASSTVTRKARFILSCCRTS